MKKLLIALAILLLMPFCVQAGDVPSLDSAGLNALLQKNKGKVVLVNFFATWCPPCRAEIPEIVDLRKRFPDDKLYIVGLSVDDTPEPLPAFMKETGINYPVYMAKKDITDAYNVTSVPHNAFIAPDGSVVISEPGMADARVLGQVTGDLLK